MRASEPCLPAEWTSVGAYDDIRFDLSDDRIATTTIEGELSRRGRVRWLQQLVHDTSLLFCASEAAQEGHTAHRAKRVPDFERFPRRA